jgi:small-conductance mechanosensitive channel
MGGTVVLAIVGASWTAIAAVLGAATFGISLALQDVGRGFVNGVYILVERPFRIGDYVRVGVAAGRVEEVGVRLTTLRTASGDRIIVPNTVVFSSIIENSSVGMVDRQKYLASGVELPVAEIEDAVIASLRGTPHLAHQAPVVEVIRSSPDGTDIEITVQHDIGVRIDDQVIDRLRSLFPEATVATKLSTAAL